MKPNDDHDCCARCGETGGILCLVPGYGPCCMTCSHEVEGDESTPVVLLDDESEAA